MKIISAITVRIVFLKDQNKIRAKQQDKYAYVDTGKQLEAMLVHHFHQELPSLRSPINIQEAKYLQEPEYGDRHRAKHQLVLVITIRIANIKQQHGREYEHSEFEHVH